MQHQAGRLNPHSVPQLTAAGQVAEPPKNTFGGLCGPHYLLPHLYPSLVLPRHKAIFRIETQRLQFLLHNSGELDIRGTTGRRLLHAGKIHQPPGYSQLKISSVDCTDKPRTTVRTPRMTDPSFGYVGRNVTSSERLEVYGRQESPYGILERVHDSDLVHLLCAGAPAMQIQVQNAEQLVPRVRNTQGELLAEAGIDSTDTSCWKLEVEKNVDAILVTTCLLARLLMLSFPGHQMDLFGLGKTHS